MAVSRNRRLARLHSHVRSVLVSGAANGLANSGLGSDQTTVDDQPEQRQRPGVQWTGGPTELDYGSEGRATPVPQRERTSGLGRSVTVTGQPNPTLITSPLS